MVWKSNGRINIHKVKFSRHRPGVAQRVGRGIALLFHDRGTRRGWVVSSTPRPQFTPGKDPVHILQEAGWAPGPVWTGGKSRPHQDSIPDRAATRPTNIHNTHSTHKRTSCMAAHIKMSAVTQPACQESESFITLLNNSPFLSTAVIDPWTQYPLPQQTTYLKRKHDGRLRRAVTFSKNSL